MNVSRACLEGRTRQFLGAPLVAGRSPLEAVRFALAGAVVTLTTLGLTIGLAEGAVVPFQVALVLSWFAGLMLQFSLQRSFVWRKEGSFALPVHRQAARYLLLAAAQYAVTASVTATVPRALGVPVTPVYLIVWAAVVLTNFLVFPTRLFHRDSRQ